MKLLKRINRYFVKFPIMMVLLIAGFILEYLAAFPFALAYYIDRLSIKKNRR